MSNCIIIMLALIVSGIALAEPPDPKCPGDHPSCKEAGADGYSVTIEGDVDGKSEDNWLLGVGGKNSIGFNAATAGHDVGDFTSLHFFTGSDSPFGSVGATCFSVPAELTQATIKQGKGGRAQAAFWFDGKTDDGITSVLYALALFGLFDTETAWPPEGTPHVMMMTDWKIIVENEGKAIKSISCIGEGDDDITVQITVTKESS